MQQQLQQLAQRLSKMASQQKRTEAQVSKTLSKQILKFFLDNFDRGGSEPNTSFVPWKQRKYSYSNKILNKSGKLRNSFRIEKSTDGGFTIVNTAPYAQYINDGTADTPARPILYSSKEVEAMINKELAKSLSNLFKL